VSWRNTRRWPGIRDLFGAAHTLLRHLLGGIGVATVAACTVFAAISGSSVATALTIGSAAIPLMIRYGYSARAAYGAVGGGGTLGRRLSARTAHRRRGATSPTRLPPGRAAKFRQS
jgi:TRAP-type mannitol/chloroaromatic compound transport system permease large subunit